MMKQKSNSLADQVFERLESDVLSGVYARGTYITELQVCEDLGVSRTPVREALTRLEQEHMIESTGKGMRVLSITVADARAIYKIRLQVELLAVASCVKNATDEQIKELEELVELQEFYVSKQNSEQLKITDGQFHGMIYQCCDSTIYADTLQPLVMKLAKIRKTSLTNPKRAGESIAEHRMILSAIKARDEEAAVSAIRSHIMNATSYMEKQMEDFQ